MSETTVLHGRAYRPTRVVVASGRGQSKEAGSGSIRLWWPPLLEDENTLYFVLPRSLVMVGQNCLKGFRKAVIGTSVGYAGLVYNMLIS